MLTVQFDSLDVGVFDGSTKSHIACQEIRAHMPVRAGAGDLMCTPPVLVPRNNWRCGRSDIFRDLFHVDRNLADSDSDDPLCSIARDATTVVLRRF